MEEIDVPVEHLSEEIHHKAAHAKIGWMTLAALLSTLLAVLAAITGLQSGHYANQAMRLQIAASDDWGYYQAKGIKAAIAELAPKSAIQETKLKKYEDEQAAIKADAESKNRQSEQYLERHEIVARAVTMAQIAIAMIAIAVLMKRPYFLWLSAILGLIGLYFFVQSALG